MKRLSMLALCGALFAASPARADPPVIVTFEAAGADAAAITGIRDSFRAAVGGGSVAGANGSFGGLRREISWDGVPDAFSDPNLLPGNFFNATSPRGAVLATPGTGFLVSANAGGAVPVLFGFSSDLQSFSPQKLFTPVASNITDVTFFLPGTTTAATTSAFGLVFVDVESAGSTHVDFFDAGNALIFSRDVLVAGNQGLSFLGATVSGDSVARVRITSGSRTIVANGVLGSSSGDFVAMDDFLYAEPAVMAAVPEPQTFALMALGLSMTLLARRRRTART